MVEEAQVKAHGNSHDKPKEIPPSSDSGAPKRVGLIFRSAGGCCSGIPPGRGDRKCYWVLAPTLLGVPALPNPLGGPVITADSPLSPPPGALTAPFHSWVGKRKL